jgi:DNA-binding IscR family transcriptional regulator
MLLSQTAEYALRAMAWLSLQSRSEPQRARDLSAATQIPLHYLSKILRRLVLAGLLTSDEDTCAFGWGTCGEENPCPLHGAWSEIKQAMQDWAQNTTLDSVTEANLSGAPGGHER